MSWTSSISGNFVNSHLDYPLTDLITARFHARMVARIAGKSNVRRSFMFAHWYPAVLSRPGLKLFNRGRRNNGY